MGKIYYGQKHKNGLIELIHWKGVRAAMGSNKSERISSFCVLVRTVPQPAVCIGHDLSD